MFGFLSYVSALWGVLFLVLQDLKPRIGVQIWKF